MQLNLLFLLTLLDTLGIQLKLILYNVNPTVVKITVVIFLFDLI